MARRNFCWKTVLSKPLMCYLRFVALLDSWYQDPMLRQCCDSFPVACFSILLSPVCHLFLLHSIFYASGIDVLLHFVDPLLRNCMERWFLTWKHNSNMPIFAFVNHFAQCHIRFQTQFLFTPALWDMVYPVKKFQGKESQDKVGGGHSLREVDIL